MVLLVAGFLLAGALGYGAVTAWPLDHDASVNELANGDPKRGAYLARAAGCIGCHTDIDGGGKPLAGGPPLETPFGTFHAPNITTDEEAGIGGWSLADFDRAVRGGISPDGEPYYPAFPYAFYAGMSDQDIADLYAAFATVKPVAEPGPVSKVGFPFNQRSALKVWRVLFFDGARLEPELSQTEAWNRGKYLVRGPLHCGACHTPRNALGARETTRRFEGSDSLPGGGSAPAITVDALRDDGWTVRSLAYSLKSGLTPSGDAFGGLMGEVVRDSTRFLNESDRRAIAAYLLNQGEDGWASSRQPD